MHPGFFNRLAYTWIGVVLLSYCFYWWALYVYAVGTVVNDTCSLFTVTSDVFLMPFSLAAQMIGRGGASTFSQFTDVPIHVFHMRSMSWFLVMLVPVVGMVFDVSGKVYSNMFYPTQTQIHVEIFCKGLDGATSENENSQLEAQDNGTDSNV